MNAARAAAMSDPGRNHWLRRRWQEPPISRPRVASSTGVQDLTRMEWVHHSCQHCTPRSGDAQ